MDNNEFKESDIGLIPNDWELKTFSDIVNIIGGGTPKTKIEEYWNGQIPWLSVVDFNNDFRTVHETEKTITELGLNNSSTKILKKGELIISARGTVGAIAQVGRDMAFNQSCYGLRAKSDITNNDFIYYLLKYSLNILKQSTHGSTFDTITRNTFDLLKVPFPSISEQQIIAKILASLDDKIELNNKMNQNLEEIGKTIFKHWFVHFEFPNEDGKPYKSRSGEMVDSELGMIPKGWEVSKIGNTLKTVLGGTPSRKNDSYWTDGVINWINSGEVNKFRITEPTELITEEALKKSATKLLPKGTTVLAITGATLGQISRLEIDSCANQSVVGVLGSDEIPSEYSYFWMKHIIKDIMTWQSGGAHQHINKQNINDSKILIPEKIVLENYINIIRPIFDKISSSCFEISSLSQIRDSLLPKLMSGKIRVPLEEK
jgi:type I restriction enzyme S subunit